MSEAAVVFDGVWKKFRRGERHDSLRDLVPALARRMLGRVRSRDLESDQDFWALKDVSFEVKPGEALGIIGPNGAGKSTALKLLTKILRPTRGTCHLHGRVGALIEVAAGFHPDLTGRENVFLQGAIMGMKRAEIALRLDEIITFAGVEGFIDTPVKRYSSGMSARLGFSIAAHLDPTVLIIDEVLSVGDMAFQRRCVERMEDFRRAGVAIVFVSHDMASVARLCGTSMYVNGTRVAIGKSGDVIQRYVTATRQPSESSRGDEIEIESATFVGKTESTLTIEPGAPLALRVSYVVKRPIQDITLGLLLYRSTDQLVVYDGNFGADELGLDALMPGEHFVVDFRLEANLTRGQYHFECHVYHNATQRFVSRLGPAGSLTVQETRTYAGVADLRVLPTVARQFDAATMRPLSVV